MTFFLTGLIAALAIIFLLIKLPLRRVLWLDVPVDIIVTAALVFMFAGTFAGMMAAVMAGCIVSIFLYVAKRQVGYERPRRDRFKVRWERVQP